MVLEEDEPNLEMVWQTYKAKKRELKKAKKDFEHLRATMKFLRTPILSEEEWSVIGSLTSTALMYYRDIDPLECYLQVWEYSLQTVLIEN